AWLLAVAIPPWSPWWIIVIGLIFAIVIAKHLYGGIGQNLFNPAMVAYVVLLISFPVQMTSWSAPTLLIPDHVNFADTLSLIFTGFDY
ncbi:RnfABCDGE type electron transport complex subunit D, partial [Escherichia coli]|nr:RnfABCDGE type electron transport complex subunit D [Escherichia coli]